MPLLGAISHTATVEMSHPIGLSMYKTLEISYHVREQRLRTIAECVV